VIIPLPIDYSHISGCLNWYVNFLCAHVHISFNKRSWMWGDGVLHNANCITFGHNLLGKEWCLILFGVDVLNTLKKVDWKPIVRRSVHSPFFKHWEWISTTRTVMSHFGVWYFKHVKKKLWWETHYGKECIFPVFKHWEWIFNNNKTDISFWCWHLNTLKKLGRKPTMGRSLHSPFLSI
jgi:hypothetical protein